MRGCAGLEEVEPPCVCGFDPVPVGGGLGEGFNWWDSMFECVIVVRVRII